MGVRAVVYLQVEPEWSYGGDRVRGAKVVRMTQNKPGDRQQGGTVLVKLTIELAESAFKPLQPEVVVVVPDGLALAQPVRVEAGDPS